MVSQTKMFIVASCFLKVAVLLLQLYAYGLEKTAAVSRNLSLMKLDICFDRCSGKFRRTW